MKSGASDPFGDEGERTDSSADDTPEESTDTGRGEPDTQPSSGIAESAATDSARGLSRSELPYVLRRERVKDERPEVHQLFVQQDTHARAVDAERTLEDELGVDLSRTDAREAIYLAGMAHLDEAAEILREWGYDL